MAICKSATRYDNDSYYETIVDEANEEVTVRGTKNGEPVEWSLGGGGGDNVLMVKITIDDANMQATADKTYQEIASAIQAGQTVNGLVNYSSNPTQFTSCSNFSYDLDNSNSSLRSIAFSLLICGAMTGSIESLMNIVVTIKPDDTKTVEFSMREFN